MTILPLSLRRLNLTDARRRINDFLQLKGLKKSKAVGGSFFSPSLSLESINSKTIE